jgi:hypothetical protein
LVQVNFASIPYDSGGGPLPSIDVADALLDERGKLGEWAGRSRERVVSGLRAVLHRAHTSEP